MALRKGEGAVNRQAFLDSISNDSHELTSDIRFYMEQYAHSETLAKDYFKMRHFRKAYVMWRDKCLWKKRILYAEKIQRKLFKVNRAASKWL